MSTGTDRRELALAEHADSTTPSASVVPFQLKAFRRWLGEAKPGDRLEYHRGFLTVDRSSASRHAERERRVLAKLADAALQAAEADRVHLVQRRNGPADFTYFAIKARPTAQRAGTALPLATFAAAPGANSSPCRTARFTAPQRVELSQ
jgi:hypothetical protein